MKKIFSIFCLVIFTMAFQACVRESLEAPVQPTITITAQIPEEPLTKASFSVPVSGTGLHLAWQAGDDIRVISGSNSAVYYINDGFTDHVAQFTGTEVAGDTFDVIAPGAYSSVAEAETGNLTLTQTGNGSTAHMVFTAMLGGVSKENLSKITFSDAWASQHGATFKRGGVVKFVLTLPAAVTAPKKVTMTGIGPDVSVNITGVSLTSEHVLTAYAQCGWDDVDIPQSTSFTVNVLDHDGTCYAATKTITAAGKKLQAGAQNIITITDGFAEALFAGGDGSEANPYLIANAKQMNNMHVNGVLKSEDKRYFRLVDNIDMSAIDWVPLNQVSPYDLPVNFDGNGKTIDKLTISTDSDKYKQVGLFGVLYGEVYNLTFTNASVTNSYGMPTGILSGYCGYNGKKSHVYNVHINGSINYSSSLGGANGNGPVGAFAGRIHTCVIESCSAFDINILSTKAFAGGIFGIDWSNGSIVRNCWTSGSITCNGQRTGGIAGSLIKQGTAIINCFSTATITAPRGIGGIVGYANMDSGSGKGYTDNMPDYVIKGCIAWQSQLRTSTYNGETSTNNFWSSGAIVSGTSTHNYLSNCWRRADLDFRDYSGEFTLYDQADASPSSPLVVNNPKPATFTNYYPYHGKAAEAGKTLSQVAKQIGWNETVWDLSGATPVLTGALEPAATSGNDNLPSVATTSRAFPANNSTSNGLTWTVSEIRNGIRYYRGYGNPTDTWWADKYSTSAAGQCQEIFVVDLDLSYTDYDVKVVVANPSAPTSEVFRQTGAIAAINGGYEKASIAVKGNMFLDTENEVYTNYPNGYAYSYMPKNTIGDTGVANWKSEGTFYSDGHQGVRIAFDAYAGGATGKTNTSGTTLKSVEEMRDYYMFNTENEAGFISSAPILDANYIRFGMTFYSRAASGSNAESPKVHQGSCYSRTAVGIAYPNGDDNEAHLLLIVNDGKYTNGTRGYGMSAYQLERVIANFFGPKYLLNLDGGGSSTMCVEGKGDEDTHVVNYPSDNYTGKTDTGKVDHAGERSRDSFIVIVPAE